MKDSKKPMNSDMNSSSRMPSSSSENRANQGSSSQNREPCRHYQRGNCIRGKRMQISPFWGYNIRTIPCRHYQRGNCIRGKECGFPHPSVIITGESERPRWQPDNTVGHFPHGERGYQRPIFPEINSLSSRIELQPQNRGEQARVERRGQTGIELREASTPPPPESGRAKTDTAEDAGISISKKGAKKDGDWILD